MYELLNNIGSYALAANVAALVIYQFICTKRTSFSFLMFAVCLMGFLHFLFQMEIEKLYGISEHKQLVRYLWYFGFAVSDFALVYLCIDFCRKHELLRDKATNFILITYMLQGLNQLVRFADRYIVGSRVLDDFYAVAIPTLNLGVTFVAWLFVLSIIAEKFFKQSIKSF